MTFLSAFLLGILASAHCAAMCSGLHQAVQPSGLLLSKERLAQHVVALNAGRIFSYVFIGSVLAGFGFAFSELFALQSTTHFARVATAVVLLLIGAQLVLHKTSFFSLLEPVANRIWSAISPLLPKQASDKLAQTFVRGFILGFLPCGLLYAVFLTAALTGEPLRGAEVMMGFGMGTLPSLTLSGLLWLRFKRWFHDKKVRIAGGLFYLMGGVLMLSAPSVVSAEFASNYPGLISLVFCT